MPTSIKRRTIAAAATLAAGMMATTAAAVVIDFEQPIDTGSAPSSPIVLDGDEFVQSGFYIDAFSNADTSSYSPTVGALVDGSDLAGTCPDGVCPTNDATHFYATLHAGGLVIGDLAGNAFSVKSFDASFFGAATAGELTLQGVLADGSGSVTETFDLGHSGFGRYLTHGAFASDNFAFLYISGFACDTGGECTAAGGFALDNLDVAAVPEPSAWASLALGLAGIGALARRQRSKKA